VFAGEFVKLVLSIGKQKVKTTALEGNDPIFNQYFMFNIPDPKEDLRIALYTVKKKICIGDQVLLSPEKTGTDTILDIWNEFKAFGGTGVFSVHIRAIYSQSSEKPPTFDDWSFPKMPAHQYLYEQFLNQFKTGDLIAFDGIGLIPSVGKTLSGTDYSSVGMIASLPSKYSREPELFLVEIARDHGYYDAFTEQHTTGVSIVRLVDRLYQFVGQQIWWVPIQKPLNRVDIQKIRECVFKAHHPNSEFHKTLSTLTIPVPAQKFLEDKLGPLFIHNTYELHSTALIQHILAAVGISIPNRPEYTSPISVIGSQYYLEPTLLRKPKDGIQKDNKDVSHQPIYIALQNKKEIPLWGEVLDEVTSYWGMQFVKACIAWLKDQQGSTIQGIFRLSGDEYSIMTLKTKTKSGDFNFPVDLECHVVSSLLKRYFREMKEPLLTWQLYEAFLAVAELDPSEMKKGALAVLKELPQNNLLMFLALFQYLHSVSANHKMNLMDAKNLAIVFGPNILRPKTETEAGALNHSNTILDVTELLINHVQYFEENLIRTTVQEEEMSESEFADVTALAKILKARKEAQPLVSLPDEEKKARQMNRILNARGKNKDEETPTKATSSASPRAQSVILSGSTAASPRDVPRDPSSPKVRHHQSMPPMRTAVTKEDADAEDPPKKQSSKNSRKSRAHPTPDPGTDGEVPRTSSRTKKDGSRTRSGTTPDGTPDKTLSDKPSRSSKYRESTKSKSSGSIPRASRTSKTPAADAGPPTDKLPPPSSGSRAPRSSSGGSHSGSKRKSSVVTPQSTGGSSGSGVPPRSKSADQAKRSSRYKSPDGTSTPPTSSSPSYGSRKSHHESSGATTKQEGDSKTKKSYGTRPEAHPVNK